MTIHENLGGKELTIYRLVKMEAGWVCAVVDVDGTDPEYWRSHAECQPLPTAQRAMEAMGILKDRTEAMFAEIMARPEPVGKQEPKA